MLSQREAARRATDVSITTASGAAGPGRTPWSSDDVMALRARAAVYLLGRLAVGGWFHVGALPCFAVHVAISSVLRAGCLFSGETGTGRAQRTAGSKVGRGDQSPPVIHSFTTSSYQPKSEPSLIGDYDGVNIRTQKHNAPNVVLRISISLVTA